MTVVAETIDLTIDSLNAAGDGVARHGRRTITVPFVIPGERVRVRSGPPRGDIVPAELVEILAPSPHRVTPRCRHFGPHAYAGRVCGGCSWQHIAYAEQLRIKTDLVTRLVRAAVPTAPPARTMLPATAEDDPWHYRQKAHFVVGSPGPRGPLLLGHYARLSRRIVPIEECPVHDERGNAVAFAVHAACQAAGVRSVKGIAVRAGLSKAETMATIVIGDERDRKVRDATRRALAGPQAPTSMHVNTHPRDNALIFGPDTRHISGPERLREDAGGVSFLISPTAFFQTNVRAAKVLVDQVLSAVPEEARVLDLYAGAGLFALPLARRGHQVVAVEENHAAVADGEASLRLSRIPPEQCRFIARPVEAALRAIARLLPSPDVVVLDPPREGCRASVLEQVFSTGHVPTAIYVSCNPESLARDLARLTSWGYRIDSMQPVDMFPHTPHIETVVILRRSATKDTKRSATKYTRPTKDVRGS